MTLYEFMMKRLEELGMKKADLVNKYDLEWSTLGKIAHGHGIRPATQQKLALALQCSQGEIQACMAQQNPLKNVIVNKKSLAKQKKTEDDIVKKVMEERPYVSPEPEEDVVDDYGFVQEKAEEYMSGREEYRKELRHMCLKKLAQLRPGEGNVAEIYAEIGYELVKELVTP